MNRHVSMIFSALLAAGLVLGCGEEAADTAGTETSDPPEETAPPEASLFAPNETYRSHHDPDAVYTLADIPDTGSYTIVERERYAELTADQINRAVHRLKTELTTCRSGLTIDECLVNRPQCGAAKYNLQQVLREERARN